MQTSSAGGRGNGSRLPAIMVHQTGTGTGNGGAGGPTVSFSESSLEILDFEQLFERVNKDLVKFKFIKEADHDQLKGFLCFLCHEIFESIASSDVDEPIVSVVNLKRRDIFSGHSVVNFRKPPSSVMLPSKLSMSFKFFRKKDLIREAMYPVEHKKERFFDLVALNALKAVDGDFSCTETETAHCGLLGDPSLCSFCGDSKKKKFTCSGCKISYYCDVQCQKNDWKLHKAFCKQTQKQ